MEVTRATTALTNSVAIASELNLSFGSLFDVSPFAQAHLRVVTEPGLTRGDFITHTQAFWGADNPTPYSPAELLRDNYSAVYAATSGVFEVGLPGAIVSSMQFTGQQELRNYLPASGPDGTLLATS